MLLAAFLVAGTALPAHAQVSRSRMLVDAAAIAAEIEASGAGWTAADTGISILEPAERQRLLGTLTDPAIPTAAMDAAHPRPVGEELPPSLDWRDLDGDFTTPIRHQLGCGSCWAFATVGALESMVEIGADDPGIDLDLSEQELINCTDGDCEGAYLDDTLDYLVHVGATTEACEPYQATDDLPCDGSCEHVPPTRAAGWVTVGDDVTSIKHQLQYGPVIAGMKVYRDFFYYTEGVYRHVTDTLSGYHAVVIVGYDDDDEAWIIKNSWGTDWGEDTYGVTGERGWFRMAYGDSCLMSGYIYAIEADEEPDPEPLSASMLLDDPGPYAPGDVVLIRLTVQGDAEQTTPLRVMLTATDPWGEVRTLVQTPVMHTVPGEPLELELPMRLAPGAPSGDYEMLARIRGADGSRIDLLEEFSVEVDLV